MRHRQRNLHCLTGGFTLSVIVMILALGACGSGNGASRSSGNAPADATDRTDNEALLNGTIAYTQRMAVPRDAIVEVSLLDLTSGTTPVVIAEQRFRAGREMPIGFDLPYASSRIGRGRVYGVRARILVDGALWLVNEQPALVLTGGHPSVAQIHVRPAKAEG